MIRVVLVRYLVSRLRKQCDNFIVANVMSEDINSDGSVELVECDLSSGNRATTETWTSQSCIYLVHASDRRKMRFHGATDDFQSALAKVVGEARVGAITGGAHNPDDTDTGIDPRTTVYCASWDQFVTALTSAELGDDWRGSIHEFVSALGRHDHAWQTLRAAMCLVQCLSYSAVRRQVSGDSGADPQRRFLEEQLIQLQRTLSGVQLSAMQAQAVAALGHLLDEMAVPKEWPEAAASAFAAAVKGHL